MEKKIKLHTYEIYALQEKNEGTSLFCNELKGWYVEKLSRGEFDFFDISRSIHLYLKDEENATGGFEKTFNYHLNYIKRSDIQHIESIEIFKRIKLVHTSEYLDPNIHITIYDDDLKTYSCKLSQISLNNDILQYRLPNYNIAFVDMKKEHVYISTIAHNIDWIKDKMIEIIQ